MIYALNSRVKAILEVTHFNFLCMGAFNFYFGPNKPLLSTSYDGTKVREKWSKFTLHRISRIKKLSNSVITNSSRPA
jgi:hypothetical protein